MCAQAALAVEGPPKFNGVIAKHAQANGVPEALVRRVIVRESKYNAGARNGPYFGLMQISHATARSMGYRGAPSGLLDPDVNLTYAVRYLSGAYKTAGGDHNRAVRFYASGYYYDAKRKGLLASIGLGRDGKFTAPQLAAAAPAPTGTPQPSVVSPAATMTVAAAPTRVVPLPPIRGAVAPSPTQPVLAAAPAIPLPLARDAGQPRIAAVGGTRQADPKTAPVLASAGAPETTGSITQRVAPMPPLRPAIANGPHVATAAAPKPPAAPDRPRVLNAVPAPALASAGPVAPSGQQPAPLAYAGPEGRETGAPALLRGANTPMPPRR